MNQNQPDTPDCARPQQGGKTVVCLKWGEHKDGVYGAEWVNRLLRATRRHLSAPFAFVCFTDDARGLDAEVEARDIRALTIAPPLTGIWWKLALMHPRAELSGRCLFFDLDVVVVGALDDFFDLPGGFCITRNWIERRKTIFRKRPRIGNSSVFRFEAGGQPQCAEKFLQDPRAAHNDYATEQAFMTAAVGLDNLRWFPERWVRSYKRHCRPQWPLNHFAKPRIPQGAKVLAFHGSPKQHEVINGVRGSYHSLPWRELAQHWK